MKKVCFYLSTKSLMLLFASLAACNGQPVFQADAQISEYVVEIFEDQKGNLWFGTMSDGVARFDGEMLTYFSEKDGLAGSTVASITEDQDGNMWFGTHSGLSRFDGKTFTNFTTKEGLCHDRVSNILLDSGGTIWVGTWGGVCRFDGSVFSDFPLPLPDVDVPDYLSTANWVTVIMEDSQGHIWFGRSGFGACRYNIASGEFIHFTKKDGLASNCVQTILEDKNGHVWFGTRVAERDHPDPDSRSGDGGLSRYDGETFVQYPEWEGLHHNDIYTIYEDKKGNTWIGATGVGAYRFDGSTFTLFKETDRMDLTHRFGLQAAWEDRNGVLWLGFSGGLFRFTDFAIVNVTQQGPWK